MAKKTFVIYKDKYKQVTRQPRWYEVILSKALHGIVFLCISYFLYKQLYKVDANPIVLTYFSLLGLACIEVIGLPVSKLSNISSLQK
jgi:uncharacterized membrane protein